MSYLSPLRFSLSRHSTWRACAVSWLVASAFATGSALADTAPRISGEASKNTATKSVLEQTFRGDVSQASTVSFFAVDPDKIERIKQSNVSSRIKRVQVGINQVAADESFEGRNPDLNWQRVDGGKVAVFKVRAPGATGVRVGLQTEDFPANAEIRVAGSDSPFQVVYTASATEVNTLQDVDKRYWTVMTEGDTQTVEVYVPLGKQSDNLKIVVDSVSHIFASANDGFKAASTPKDNSGSCNVNAICVAGAGAPQGIINAKNATAHMQFTAPDGTYVCTGTLLNDNNTSTQVPYFYSANHCISTQSEANTLSTYWGYENTTCSGSNFPRSSSTLVAGGADLLYQNKDSDVLLLRLKNQPPASAFFLGWDANETVAGTAMSVFHHPQGDPKKYSVGQIIRNQFYSGDNATFIVAGYTSGTTEGGSSGSGLLTQSNGDYFLRGGLYRGAASCANSGNLNNAGNTDDYSQFSAAFSFLRRWLFDDTGTQVVPLSKRGGIDLDGNNRSALVVRSDAAQMQAGRLVNNTFQWTTLTDPGASFRLLGAVDLAGNGKSDLAMLNVGSLNANGQGQARYWTDFSSNANNFLRDVKPEWDVQALGDLDGDGFGDLVWRFRGMSPNFDDQGVSYIWFTDGANFNQVRKRGGAPLTWTLLGAADLNGDNAADMVYVAPAASDGTQAMRVLMATPQRTCANLSGGTIPSGFTPIKLADFTGSRRGDVLARNNTTGAIRIISLSAAGLTLPPYTGRPDDRDASCTSSSLIVSQTSVINTTSDATWSVYATGDFDGNGLFDIVFRRPSDNALIVWLMQAGGASPTVINAGTAPSGFSAIALQ